MYKCIVSSVTESRSLPTRRQKKKSINHNFPYAYVNLLLIKKKKERRRRGYKMELSNDRKMRETREAGEREKKNEKKRGGKVG